MTLFQNTEIFFMICKFKNKKYSQFCKDIMVLSFELIRVYTFVIQSFVDIFLFSISMVHVPFYKTCTHSNLYAHTSWIFHVELFFFFQNHIFALLFIANAKLFVHEMFGISAIGRTLNGFLSTEETVESSLFSSGRKMNEMNMWKSVYYCCLTVFIYAELIS